ncbi:response regulator [uncultured Roseobacter sp.]|uniref:response regulator n=1 Tax=uncultured Roseobacter sp. TaxID=114847 RepID=UPI002636F32A|nr:response regulator [uncultured Roseobacter sp.]
MNAAVARQPALHRIYPRPIAVVIIDDNQADRLLLQKSLEGTGLLAQVTTVSDTRELKQVMREEAVDVVIVDYHLPDVRGDRVVSALRDFPVSAGCGCILVSSSPELAASSNPELAVLDKNSLTPLLMQDAVLTAMSDGKPSRTSFCRPDFHGNEDILADSATAQVFFRGALPDPELKSATLNGARSVSRPPLGSGTDNG